MRIWGPGAFALLVTTLALAGACHAELSSEVKAQIDATAERVLARTGAPSASIAVVQDGRIAYLKAYGQAELSPSRAATPQMRYAIGSISKQFTAAAILILAEQGKLTLEDPVGKYVPGLTRGDQITIRQILSHTSGYSDYWPQDYVFQDMNSQRRRRRYWIAGPRRRSISSPEQIGSIPTPATSSPASSLRRCLVSR